jgi:hypothetical protein
MGKYHKVRFFIVALWIYIFSLFVIFKFEQKNWGTDYILLFYWYGRK